MRKKRAAIIVDLDGTLCDTKHRQHLVEKKKWDEFYEALVDDRPHDWCERLVQAMGEKGYEIVFVSGRPEKYRTATLDWFDRVDSDFRCYPLFMRKDGDFRQDAIIKEEIYREHIEPQFDVQFCVDDRKQVVDMWRSIGLTCLQCAEGNF